MPAQKPASVDLISTLAGLFLAQNIKRNPRQFLARLEANLGCEIEICPRHQILAQRGVFAGAKTFYEMDPISERGNKSCSYLGLDKHSKTYLVTK